jgi:hypothetical protein
MVNEKLPACVGIPVIWPDTEALRPGGSEPAAIDHAYGAEPPVADSVAE